MSALDSLAANLELLFTEAGDLPERIHAAADHGFTAVEMWGWRDRDASRLRAALDATGVELLSMIVDPKMDLTDPATHEDYLQAVDDSLAAARVLRPANLVVVAGDSIAGVPGAEQRSAVVSVLTRAAQLAQHSAVTLLLENLNSRVDHVGTHLDSVPAALSIIREVNSPKLRLLLDAYHAWTMEEDLSIELDDAMRLVGHVQIADVPGRGEPGSGKVDWIEKTRFFRDSGYRGRFGLEYFPTTETSASLSHIEHVLDELESAGPPAP